MYLSKSDFKIARTCGTKLYYRKLHYPSTQNDDPYLEFLADGGYMVEAIAKLLFPEGREITTTPGQDGFEATMEALTRTEVTLFEATLLHDQMLARVDILERRGNNFRLIEVKAKSFDSQEDLPSPFRGKKGRISKKWLPYLEDVAFQKYILSCIFPGAQVTTCLCLVDKSKTSNVETTFDKFHISPRSKDLEGGTFQKPTLSFTGDVAALRKQPFVQICDVTSEVEELLPKIKEAAATFTGTLIGETPIRIAPKLGVICKKCEYRIEGLDQNGFRECWGKLANASPHLLDLYRVDLLAKDVISKLIEEGRCSLDDISPNDFRGIIGERQTIQLESTLVNKEFINPELLKILDSCKYPIHFVDFEASRTAVPYHLGMRPYEQVAFQWSCHTIPALGEDLIHREWINVDEAYPNFEFARSLKEAITREGTVFVWSSFEKSALTDVRDQLVRYDIQDQHLFDWLGFMVGDSSPIIDLYRLALEYYFHPNMGGSLSIKDVLPTIWFQNASLRLHPWFSEYFIEQDGRILGPYETLERLPFGELGAEEEGEAVHEGMGAVRTYQEMMYGLRRSDPSFREAMKQLLLNYCKLDTAAMVMIWMHWRGGGSNQ